MTSFGRVAARRTAESVAGLRQGVLAGRGTSHACRLPGETTPMPDRAITTIARPTVAPDISNVGRHAMPWIRIQIRTGSCLHRCSAGWPCVESTRPARWAEVPAMCGSDVELRDKGAADYSRTARCWPTASLPSTESGLTLLGTRMLGYLLNVVVSRSPRPAQRATGSGRARQRGPAGGRGRTRPGRCVRPVAGQGLRPAPRHLG